MTLSRFQKLLRKVNPKLRIRMRGYGDIGGVFAGRYSCQGGYIARLTKGEFHQNGYRHAVVDPENKMRLVDGNIKKRGRKTVVNLLRNYRWVTNHRQRTMLMQGIER